MQGGCLPVTRIVFSKTGYAKYISHLDLTRCMARMFARANVPIWYTEGFNPHPYMVFSAALPIGVYGENELLDIKLNEKADYKELLDRMNKAAPEGISFKEIYDSDKDFKYVEKAVYEIKIPANISEKFKEFIASPEILVSKKTKRGETTVDLKAEISIKETESKDGYVIFEAIAPCGNEKNISPTLLTGAFSEKTGDDTIFEISRISFLAKNSEIFR